MAPRRSQRQRQALSTPQSAPSIVPPPRSQRSGRSRPLPLALSIVLVLGWFAYHQWGPLVIGPGDRVGVDTGAERRPGIQGAQSPKVAPTPSDSRRNPREQPKGWSGELTAAGETWISREGLRYSPGSAEGHRLQHIMRHLQDMPDRDVHGVFDAENREQLVALIDEAYSKSRQSPRVSERQRTIYTVDLGRRIGYVGGRAGKRKNYPACNKMKLVLQQKSVITAYPVER